MNQGQLTPYPEQVFTFPADPLSWLTHPRGYRTFLSVASIPATVQSSSPIFRGATRNELFT